MELDSAKFLLSIEKPRCDGQDDQDSSVCHDLNPTASENQEVEYLVVKITSKLAQIGRNASIIFKENEIQPQRSHLMFGDSDETRSTDENNEGFLVTPRRKRKAKSKSSQSTDLVVHKNLSPAEPPKSYFELYEISNDVTVKVQKLRDNGRWDLFEEMAVTMSRKYTSFDAQIVLLYERAMAACYNNRLEEARKMIKSGITIASGSENAGVLVGRGLYYLSAVYRREHKAGKAVDRVTMAEQSFSNYGVMTDRCALTYERASALMDFILQCPQPKPALLEEVMSSLKQAIDECLFLLDKDEPNFYVKTHHYSFIKMAMLLLDCRNSVGRKRSVKKENIDEAERLLSTLKDKYWDKTSRGEKTQYYFGQADLNFRRAQYQKAEEFALKALEMAELFGFNTEIRLARERLDDIRSAWYQNDLSLESRDSKNDPMPSTDGHVTDISASSDSDWLIQPPI